MYRVNFRRRKLPLYAFLEHFCCFIEFAINEKHPQVSL